MLKVEIHKTDFKAFAWTQPHLSLLLAGLPIGGPVSFGL